MADKPDPKADDTYSEEDAARRRDATIRAMIGMKPKAHKSIGTGKKSPRKTGKLAKSK
jgi:hypothetical protein